MVFEGIVISKIPYKERDLIVKLLLRNGMVAGFYVYGGQGGGKHHKPSAFDVGAMMKMHTREKRSRGQEQPDLLIPSEFQRLWAPENIRHNIQAYYLLCLFVETIQKFAIAYHPDHHRESTDQEGVFSVVSNALFYLEHSLKTQSFLAEQQLMLFLVKLLFYLGIMPDTDHCGYCGQGLMEGKGASFLLAQGQFSCLQCVSAEDEKGLLLRIKQSTQTKYQDYATLTGANFRESDKLLQYFCHHFHIRPVELRSYSLLFK